MNTIAQTSSLSDFLRVVHDAKTRTNLAAVKPNRSSAPQAAAFSATFAPQPNPAAMTKTPAAPAAAYSQRPMASANAGKIVGNFFDAYA